MSEPFLAEVRIVGFNFAPRGWAFCDGQILPINQNQSLYSLLGTTYGGDGRTSFALPDLRGRTPIHVGRSNGGAEHLRERDASTPTHDPWNEQHGRSDRSYWPLSGPDANPRRQSLSHRRRHHEPCKYRAAQRRRWSSPREYAAVSLAELLHSAAGPFPVT